MPGVSFSTIKTQSNSDFLYEEDNDSYCETESCDFDDEEKLLKFGIDVPKEENLTPQVSNRYTSRNASEEKSTSNPSINFIASPSSNFMYTQKNTNKKSDNSDLKSPSNLLQSLQSKNSRYKQRFDNDENDTNTNWNKLNLSLFFAYTFSTAATSVPIAIIPAIFESFSITYSSANDYTTFYISSDSSTSASSRVAQFAILGCALGKFLNGHLSDVFGARKIAIYFSLLMALSLYGLSFATGPKGVFWFCALVEFFQSVQWSCCVNVLAAHYHYEGMEDKNGTGKEYEQNTENEKKKDRYTGGIYVTSLASRFGALVAMPFCALLLNYTSFTWRNVARLGAFVSCTNSLIYYFLIWDSPTKLHSPINPIRNSKIKIHSQHHHAHQSYIDKPGNRGLSSDSIWSITAIFNSMMFETVYPSIKEVLSNGTFWIVSFAHTGGSIIRSSERILATYYHDTTHYHQSNNTDITSNMNQSTSGLVVFLSFGLFFGVISLGNVFTNARNDEKRKSLVITLYIATVCMCYTLALLSITKIQSLLLSPTIIRIMQLMATFCMGACISVPYYHIPPIVAAQFGKEKGMYSSYTEGVAFLLSSMVWKQVGDAVERGNPTGNGWAYGWAFIALLVIVSGVIMVEFMDHYFCRRGDWNRNVDDQGFGIGFSFGRGRKSNAHYNSYESKNLIAMEEETKGLIDKKDLLRRRGNALNGFKKIIEKPSLLFKSKNSASFDEDEAEPLTSSETITFFEENQLELSPTRSFSHPTLQERLEHLLDKDENQTCVDCPNKLPRWASILMPHQDNQGVIDGLGCFVCQECAGAHRNLGVHVCFVRSVDHDEWKESEVRAMERGGNSRVNLLYEYLLVNKTEKRGKPNARSSGRDRERFAIHKYLKKQYYVDSLDALSNIDDENLISPFSDDDSYNEENSESESLIEMVNSYSPRLSEENEKNHLLLL